MTLTQSINIYGKRYENGKSYFTNIKSDFDIIREIEKIHKCQIYAVRYELASLTLMCSVFHGQPYNNN